MRIAPVKWTLAALALSGLLAGCATTVEMGGPFAYYRYHFDSGAPVVYESAPAVVYRSSPTVVYRAPPAVTLYSVYSP